MKRNATAVWQGSGKEGKGNISTAGKALDKTPYSHGSRFADAPGTNPEELLAAAHAGCFTMKLSFVLNEAGFTADELETKCEVDLSDGAIGSSHLTVTAKVPGIDKAKFDECVANAKDNCPVSKLYNTTITADATLS